MSTFEKNMSTIGDFKSAIDDSKLAIANIGFDYRTKQPAFCVENPAGGAGREGGGRWRPPDPLADRERKAGGAAPPTPRSISGKMKGSCGMQGMHGRACVWALSEGRPAR